MNVVIIDYGAGNIKSIQFALNRLGVNAVLTNDVTTIEKADRIIFPGVGEASSAMTMLKKNRLDRLIPELKQPVLGICLGMQLMCNSTEEGKTSGLGIFKVNVKRFTNKLKVPHVGWNSINHLKSKLFQQINEGDFMYATHSYYAEICPKTIATTEYNITFSAALEQNNFFGVQFHPEKSGSKGEQILKNFLDL